MNVKWTKYSRVGQVKFAEDNLLKKGKQKQFVQKIIHNNLTILLGVCFVFYFQFKLCLKLLKL